MILPRLGRHAASESPFETGPELAAAGLRGGGPVRLSAGLFGMPMGEVLMKTMIMSPSPTLGRLARGRLSGIAPGIEMRSVPTPKAYEPGEDGVLLVGCSMLSRWELSV